MFYADDTQTASNSSTYNFARIQGSWMILFHQFMGQTYIYIIEVNHKQREEDDYAQ
jgi:hypothetical protein